MELKELNEKYCPALKMTRQEYKNAIENNLLPHIYHKKYLSTAKIINNVFAYLERGKITQSKALELTTAILAELCESNKIEQNENINTSFR